MCTPKKTILQANDIPVVAIDFMNHTHYEEVALVSTLGEQIESYQNTASPSHQDAEKISALLAQWLEHTIEHFKRENELMKHYHFPAYETHYYEHEISLDKMKAIIQQWNDSHDINELAKFVFITWPAWFNGHLASMDNVTARYAMMSGYENNQAKAS